MKDRPRPGKSIFRVGRGRPLALFLLLLAGLALAHIGETPLATVRNLLFDSYQRRFPRDRTEIPAVVVQIDEKSLQAYGQWPWPRTVVARLIDRILAARPLALGIDLLFVEPDRYSPAELEKHLPVAPKDLRGLPEPDDELAKALGKGRTVLAAVGGEKQSGPSDALPGLPSPRIVGPDVRVHTPFFPAALGSRPSLTLHAASQGLINGSLPANQSSQEMGVVRRVPLLARVGERIVPTLGLEMLRQALETEEIRVEAGSRGMEAVGVGDYRLPVLVNGELALHFGPFDADRYFSAADVLAGAIPGDNFTARFVLVGMAGLGLQDQVVTPLGGRRLPGVDVHAQVIESFLSGHAARRPAAMADIELAALLVVGLAMVALVPGRRPIAVAAAGAILALALPAAGFAAFVAGAWLFDGVSVSILLSPAFVVLFGNSLADADEQRRAAQRDLQASREAAARLGGELDAARRIQMGLLPDPALAFAGESRFEIAARLEPAKAVGGDYYECLRLDDRKVCVAVGDVSGKGVPASLFMSMSKTLTAALARRNPDLGVAVQEVACELDRQNPEMLFVTAFVAVLDADTGWLDYVCAGHDAPLLQRAGTVSRLAVDKAGGPPICSLPDFAYGSQGVQLQPGDLLCLFTDGVTEAGNGTAFYGADRLATGLATLAGPLPGICASLVADVRAFEAGRLPGDDLTLLLLRWNGPS